MPIRREAPSREEIALLPPFPGMALEHIHVPVTPAEFAAAAADLVLHRFVGFDTESKPTFTKGEISDGPHVVQLSTLHKAYIFQLHRAGSRSSVARLLESTSLVKVGFGLESDRGQLLRKFGITPAAVLDLGVVFRREGYRKSIGVRTAVAILFKQHFRKPKSVTTTDWSQPELRDNQLLYAANDAYAALKVLHALQKPESELRISGRLHTGGLRGAPGTPIA